MEFPPQVDGLYLKLLIQVSVEKKDITHSHYFMFEGVGRKKVPQIEKKVYAKKFRRKSKKPKQGFLHAVAPIVLCLENWNLEKYAKLIIYPKCTPKSLHLMTIFEKTKIKTSLR